MSIKLYETKRPALTYYSAFNSKASKMLALKLLLATLAFKTVSSVETGIFKDQVLIARYYTSCPFTINVVFKMIFHYFKDQHFLHIVDEDGEASVNRFTVINMLGGIQ